MSRHDVVITISSVHHSSVHLKLCLRGSLSRATRRSDFVTSWLCDS